MLKRFLHVNFLCFDWTLVDFLNGIMFIYIYIYTVENERGKLNNEAFFCVLRLDILLENFIWEFSVEWLFCTFLGLRIQSFSEIRYQVAVLNSELATGRICKRSISEVFLWCQLGRHFFGRWKQSEPRAGQEEGLSPQLFCVRRFPPHWQIQDKSVVWFWLPESEFQVKTLKVSLMQ